MKIYLITARKRLTNLFNESIKGGGGQCCEIFEINFSKKSSFSGPLVVPLASYIFANFGNKPK